MATDESSDRPHEMTPASLRDVIPFGRIGGTGLYLHYTTAALLAVLGIAGGTGFTWAFYLIGGSVSLLLHEAGHALAARRRGYAVSGLVWYPLRGLALIGGDVRPGDQAVIALAGIAASATLALVIGAGFALGGALPVFPAAVHAGGVGIASALLFANMALCLLNLIPALPVDGGRALHAFLSRLRGQEFATNCVATSGTVSAFLCASLAALTGHIAFLPLAAFLFIGTAHEVKTGQDRDLFTGATVATAMARTFATVSGGSTVREAARKLRPCTQQAYYPVLLAGEPTGIVSREAIAVALAEGRAGLYVSEIMDRRIRTVSPEAPLRPEMERLYDLTAGPVALVMTEDVLVGLLTPKEIEVYIARRRQILAEQQAGIGSSLPITADDVV